MTSLLRVRLASFSIFFYSQGDVLSRSFGGEGGGAGRRGEEGKGPTLSSLQFLLKKVTETQDGRERGEGGMEGGVESHNYSTSSLFSRYLGIGSEGITPLTLPWSWWTDTTSIDSSAPSRALSPSRGGGGEEEEVDVREVMKEVEQQISGWTNRVEWAGGVLSALSMLCEAVREAHFLFAEEAKANKEKLNAYPFLQPVLECLEVVLEMIISMRAAVSPQFLLGFYFFFIPPLFHFSYPFLSDAITCLLKVHPIALNPRCYQLVSALLETMVGVASICQRWERAMEGERGGEGREGKGGVHADMAHWLVCCAHTFHGVNSLEGEGGEGEGWGGGGEGKGEGEGRGKGKRKGKGKGERDSYSK